MLNLFFKWKFLKTVQSSHSRLIKFSRSNIKTNNQIIVIVNRNDKKNYNIFHNTLKSLLIHYGFPFLEVTLDENEITEKISQPCNLIIIAHANIINNLTSEHLELITNMVKKGAGLINFDLSFTKQTSDIFSETTNITGLLPLQQIRIMINDKKCIYHLKKKLSCYHNKKINNLKNLVLKNNKNDYSLIDYKKLGSGEIINCLFPLTIWDERFGTHLGMTGQILNHLIYNVAKGPVIRTGFPGFITLRIDDVTFGQADYLDALLKKNIRPFCAIFLDNINGNNLQKYKNLIDITPHSTNWENLIFTAADFSEKYLPAINKLKSKYDFNYSSIIMPHFYKISKDNFLKLKKAGFNNIIISYDPENPDIYWDNAEPFGLPSYNYKYYEDDDILNFISEAYSKTKFIKGSLWDFLFKATSLETSDNKNHLDTITERCYETIVKSFESGFPASLTTHETRIKNLNEKEIAIIFDSVQKQLEHNGYNPLWVGIETVFNYARSLKNFEYQSIYKENNSLIVRLKGRINHKINLNCYFQSKSYTHQIGLFDGEYNGTIEL